MIDATYRDWIVTVRHDQSRTQDYPVRANSAYHARYQFLQLHPNARISAVRLSQR